MRVWQLIDELGKVNPGLRVMLAVDEARGDLQTVQEGVLPTVQIQDKPFCGIQCVVLTGVPFVGWKAWG